MTPPARRDGTPDRGKPGSDDTFYISYAKPARKQHVDADKRRRNRPSDQAQEPHPLADNWWDDEETKARKKNTDGVRLQKVLAQAGVASRRHAEVMIEQGRVVFGVVGIPANGRCYYGGAGLGAWRSEAPGDEQLISVRLAPAQGFTLVASKRHSSLAQETLLAGLAQRFGEPALANIGSSLKFCLLAEGNADCYPRLAPTSQWDTAAAQGVLEGAGGEVLNLAGEVLTYEARESFLNPSFLALPATAEWRGELIELARNLQS